MSKNFKIKNGLELGGVFITSSNSIKISSNADTDKHAEILVGAFSGQGNIQINNLINDVDTFIFGNTSNQFSSTPLFHAKADNETIGIGRFGATDGTKLSIQGDVSASKTLTMGNSTNPGIIKLNGSGSREIVSSSGLFSTNRIELENTDTSGFVSKLNFGFLESVPVISASNDLLFRVADGSYSFFGSGSNSNVSFRFNSNPPAVNISDNTILDLKNTLDATNATGDTGTLRCEGGASIAKKLFVGNNLTCNNLILSSTQIRRTDGIIEFTNQDDSISEGDISNMFTFQNEDAAVASAAIVLRATENHDADTSGSMKFDFHAYKNAEQLTDGDVFEERRRYVTIDPNGASGHLNVKGDISASGKIITSELSALGDLTIDADGADILLKDGGTSFGRFSRQSSNFVIKAESNNNDIIFKGEDDSSTITALTLDMSEAGKAIFNGDISGSATSTFTIGGNATIGGSIELEKGKFIQFGSADTYISASGTTEDLVIAADDDIILEPDDDVIFKPGGSNIYNQGYYSGMINGTADTDTKIGIGFPSSNQIFFYAGDGTDIRQLIESSEVSFRTTDVRMYGNSTTDLFFSDFSANKVGIRAGTTPPSTLTVGGDISGSGNLDIDGNVVIDGNAQFTQITASAFQFIGTGTAELEVQGNITASGAIKADGEISSSAIVYGTRFYSGNKSVARYVRSSNTMTFNTTTVKAEINALNIKLDAPVTSSGDISASGHINGKNIDGHAILVDGTTVSSGEGILFPDSTTNQITIGKSLSHVHKGTTIHGNITASGNIFSNGSIKLNGGIDNDISGSTTIKYNEISMSAGVSGSNNLQIIGNISASAGLNRGTIVARHFSLGPTTNINDTILSTATSFGQAAIVFGDYLSEKLTLIQGSNIRLTAPVTASGDISSSITSTGSFGNVQINGVGRGQLEVDYRLLQVDAEHMHSAGGGQGDIVKFGGTSTTPGDIYYLKTDATWDEAQANAGGTSTGSLAVALGNNSTTDGMLLKGMVKLDADPSAPIGAPVYLDDTTAGHARNDAPGSGGDFVRIVGHYMSGSGTIYFNPDNTFIEVAS